MGMFGSPKLVGIKSHKIMNILSREQFTQLLDQSNYREIWMYQNSGLPKWFVYEDVSDFNSFEDYENQMVGHKKRAVKRIYIEKLQPKDGDTIAVYFSCGAASAIAVKKTIELYAHRCNVVIVNNPIKEEDEDNQRFLKDVATWLNVNIQTATNSKFKSCSCIEVWDDENMMSSASGFAPCTQQLKKNARYEWESKNRPDWTVMGFTKEERGRFNNFQINERPASLYVLERTTKSECFEMITNAGIDLPRIYLMGYPNANCVGCVKATSPTYWNHVRKMHPEVFQQRAEQSRLMGTNGCRLVRVKGKRIFLDELDPNAKGQPLKNMNFECGIFCSK
jgi:hypothetical protein